MAANWAWSFIDSQYMDSTLKPGFLKVGQTVKIKHTHRYTQTHPHTHQTHTQICSGSTPLKCISCPNNNAKWFQVGDGRKRM